MSEQNGDTILDEFRPPKRVKIKGKGGEEKVYYINEAPAERFWKWFEKLTAFQLSEEPSRVNDMPKLQDELLLMCMTDVSGAGLQQATARSWGGGLRAQLMGLCQQHNPVGGGAAEAEGKSSSGAEPPGGGTTSQAASA